MSNSALVDVTQLSPNCSKPRNHPIDKITIHHMAGNMGVENCLAMFANPGRGASANYVIGTDGRVGLCVDEGDRAWTSGSRENDNRAVTIEVANDGGAPDWHISDAAFEKLIELCIDIGNRNGFTSFVWTGDKDGDLTIHKMFQATTCPGAYLESRMPEIAQRVNDGLTGGGGAPQPTPTPTSTPKGEITVEVSQISRGMESCQTAMIQGTLKYLGYDIGAAGVDGIFGAGTESAVRAFQSDKGLAVDGIVGEVTWNALSHS